MTGAEARELLVDALYEHLERKVPRGRAVPDCDGILNAFLSEPEAVEALLAARDDGFPKSKVWDGKVVHARETSAGGDRLFCGPLVNGLTHDGEEGAYRWRVPETRVTCTACRRRLRVGGRR